MEEGGGRSGYRNAEQEILQQQQIERNECQGKRECAKEGGSKI